jgi:hypothetical protein
VKRPLGAPIAPPARVARTGFVVGGGIGFGSIDLEGPRASSGDLGSIFFHAHAGGMLTPRLALLVEVWGSDHRTDRCSFDPDQLCTLFFEPRGNVTQGNAGISAQYWLTPRFWLKAGFGTSRLTFRRDGRGAVEVARGGAFLAALGYELLHERYYAIDLALRFTGAGYSDEPLFGEFDRASSGALALSFSWY